MLLEGKTHCVAGAEWQQNTAVERGHCRVTTQKSFIVLAESSSTVK